ncbi:MAG: T9SS type A sorting domain-containing protein [Chitinophagales bacterium]|nr:T9SS type A sorting domain-containing protein [Chitinophagales bacterium]
MHSRFYVAIVLLLQLFLLFKVKAEGTKEIRPTSADFGYVQIWDNNDPARIFATYDADSFSRLYIHIEDPANEVIYFGFGSKIAGPANVYYRLRDPNGNIVMGPTVLPSAGAGYINNYNDCVNGPFQLTGAGYVATSYVPLMAGSYYIEFNPSDPTIVTRTKSTWNEFDISVGHIPTSSEVKGRVYSMNWDLSTNGSTNRFYGQFYIYSNDSIVTRLNPNGFMPYGFTVTCNRNGTGNTGDFSQDRKSITTFAYYPEYKIFLNDPDSTLYPTGVASNIAATSPNIIECDTGYCISIEFTKQGQAQVILDLNGTPGFQSGTEDVKILNYVNGGQVCFAWDGEDGLGNPIPIGTPISMQAIIVSGLTNFPIWDAECNPDGFIVNAVRPSLPNPRLYYDDTELGGMDNTTLGCAAPCHSWGNITCSSPVGNNVTVNTYWFATLNSQTFVAAVPNCPPKANDDNAVTSQDLSIVVKVLANDGDANDDMDSTTLNVTAPLSPANGTISNIDLANGYITYTPNSGFVGNDTFRYLICDDLGGCDTAFVYVVVNCSPITSGIEINGYVFYDSWPPNQIMDAGDPGISGADVDIYRDFNKDGLINGGDVLLSTVTTNVSGHYSYVPTDNLVSFTNRVATGNDDAEEDYESSDLGEVDRSSSDLDLGEGYTSGSERSFVGIRFQNVNIPIGASIDSASITFKARSSESGTCNLTFVCEDVDDATSYGGSDFDITGRSYTAATVTWNGVPNWIDNQLYTTPNLAVAVQEVVDRPGWISGNSLAFGVTGTDRREADSYDGSSADAPLLYIRYDTFDVYYMMEVDSNTVPQPQYDLTTDNLESAVFTQSKSSECGNNYGFFNRVGFWPLATNIIDFEANLIHQRVQLDWAVSTELNTALYKIERSHDGENFDVIDEIDPSYYGSEDLTYSISDFDPGADQVYYKIGVTDFDDNTSYSEKRTLFLSGLEDAVELLPNKIQNGDAVHIYFANRPTSVTSVDVYDVRGNRVDMFSFAEGKSEIYFNASKLQAGLYLVSIENDKTKVVKKLFVER